MHHKVEQKFLKAIKDFELLKEGDKVIIGFSGGVDSSVLLYLLKKFQTYLGISEILAVHVNHQIRETAERDEKFSIDFATRLGVPLIIERRDVRVLAKEKKLSLEEAGRLIRYKVFEEIRLQRKFNKIATAHHGDDLIETQLLFYARGTGTQGLKGFSPKEGFIIRPLFYLTKSEIYNYAREKDITFVEDETNLDITIPRNRIRHRVIPELKHINPSLEDSAIKIFKLLSAENEFWKKHIQKLLQEVVKGDKIDLNKFENLTVAEQRSLLKEIFSNLGFENLEKLREFALSEKTYTEIGKLKLGKEKGFLIILNEPLEELSYYYTLPVEGEIFIEEINAKIASRVEKVQSWEQVIKKPKNVEYFQFEVLPDYFVVRNRKEGDKFVPFGRNKPVKLKEFFIKEKIPRWKRWRIPLLTLANNILWIVGIRRSNFYPVKDLNKKVVEVVYEQLD
jgi:tRNA(Ile)-lysidine synthase